MQTRHFDRRSTRNATLFHLAVETVLLGVLACFSSTFLAIRRLQTDGQSRLVQSVGHAALPIGLIQLAEVGVLLAECFQSLSQSGIVGLDMGGVLALVEQDDGFLFVLRQLTQSFGYIELTSISAKKISPGIVLLCAVQYRGCAV